MTARPNPDDVRAAIEIAWGVVPASVTAHDTGMNSRTWLVAAAGSTYIAKAVPASRRRGFLGGLAIAAIVEAAGIAAGGPVPTLGGATAVVIGDQVLALLRQVAGEPLDGFALDEQAAMGATLAAAHRALDGASVADADGFHWLDATAAHLEVAAWVRPAVAAAIAGYERIPPESMTWRLLHTDPAPEAFLRDPATGACGLIDWDQVIYGPAMYDVASAVMYLGGAAQAGPFLDAYVAAGGLLHAEIERTLEPVRRLRWAVQADYFARRIAMNDLTGISGSQDNIDGLEDARRALT